MKLITQAIQRMPENMSLSVEITADKIALTVNTNTDRQYWWQTSIGSAEYFDAAIALAILTEIAMSQVEKR